MKPYICVQRIVLLLSLLCSGTMAKEIPAFYRQAVMTEEIGDVDDAILYLGPSPYLYQGITEFIQSATNTLDICVYSFDLPNLAKEILAAHERGVTVRLSIYHESAASQKGRLHKLFKELTEKKILRYAENKSALMHNKFMVADHAKVWTASCNFTKTASRLNDNNAVVLKSDLLAENYTVEFNEIWNNRFGKRDADPTPHPEFMIGNLSVKNYFAPEDDLLKAVLHEIQQATNSIYLMLFSLTSKPVTEVLQEKIKQGVEVHVILDETLAVHFSSTQGILKESGADVRISPNGNQMHHKVLVIDQRTVILGSANISAAAFNFNDENMLIIDSPVFAKVLEKEFKRCWLARTYMWNKWNRVIE